eukprot:g3181.t1
MADLSAYELARERRIAENQGKLRALGLDVAGPAAIQKRSAEAAAALRKRATGKRKKKPWAEPRQGARRSTRDRKSPKSYNEDEAEWTPGKDSDEGDDSNDSDDDDDDDEDYAASVASIPKPKRIRKTSNKKPQPAALPPPSSSPPPFLTIEQAKTGRAKCRACREPIEQGAYRIGQQAWIVGRNAMTWQHPDCFVGRVCVAVEPSGRGKCKATGRQLAKGEVKLGLRSHTATAWVALSSVPAVLAPVLSVCGGQQEADTELPSSSKASSQLVGSATTGSIEGMDGLDAEQAKQVVAAAQQAAAALEEQQQQQQQQQQGQSASAEESKVNSEGSNSDDNEQDDDDDAEVAAADKAKKKSKKGKSASRSSRPPQPAVGSKTGAKGRVCWKFGAHLCYGDLLPRQETKSHCFARTHKGNTKTLTKGSSYWWILPVKEEK